MNYGETRQRHEGSYDVNQHYDPDLVDLTKAAREKALDKECRCGHARRDHYGATGALASFGGSACGECWTCGTFEAKRKG